MSRKSKDAIRYFFIYLSAAISVSALFFLVVFILSKGFSYLNLGFIINEYSPSDPNSGILPMILGTIYMVLLTLLISTPISIFGALYLNEYSKKNLVTEVIRFAIDGLTSVPSIVYGLFGFSLFVTILSPITGGYSILSGSLTLVIMILPTLIKTIEEALKTIPNDIREASLALGASKVQTLFKVILPSCISGIITAIILGMGRVISESAPLLLTAGMVYYLPTSVMDSSRTLTTHLYYLASEGVDDVAKGQAFATASVLIIIIIILNLLTKLIAKKLGKRVS